MSVDAVRYFFVLELCFALIAGNLRFCPKHIIALDAGEDVVFKYNEQVLLNRIFPSLLDQEYVVPAILVERINGYRGSKYILNLLSGYAWL